MPEQFAILRLGVSHLSAIVKEQQQLSDALINILIDAMVQETDVTDANGHAK